MSHEDPGNISFSEVGGLSEQIRELREVVELPLTNPELFQRVGITPPKGCLLFGPPGRIHYFKKFFSSFNVIFRHGKNFISSSSS